jgi:hypothetical protein
MKIMISQIDAAMRALNSRPHYRVDIAEATEPETLCVRAGSLPAKPSTFRIVSLQRDLYGNAYLDIPEHHINGDNAEIRDLENHDKGIDAAIAELTICYRVALDEHKDVEDAEVLEGLIDRLQALKDKTPHRPNSEGDFWSGLEESLNGDKT